MRRSTPVDSLLQFGDILEKVVHTDWGNTTLHFIYLSALSFAYHNSSVKRDRRKVLKKIRCILDSLNDLLSVSGCLFRSYEKDRRHNQPDLMTPTIREKWHVLSVVQSLDKSLRIPHSYISIKVRDQYYRLNVAVDPCEMLWVTTSLYWLERNVRDLPTQSLIQRITGRLYRYYQNHNWFVNLEGSLIAGGNYRPSALNFPAFYNYKLLDNMVNRTMGMDLPKSISLFQRFFLGRLLSRNNRVRRAVSFTLFTMFASGTLVNDVLSNLFSNNFFKSYNFFEIALAFKTSNYFHCNFADRQRFENQIRTNSFDDPFKSSGGEKIFDFLGYWMCPEYHSK